MNMHHHAPLHQQPQDTLSSHGRDLVSHLAIFFANQRNPIYSVEIPIITTCTESKSLGMTIPGAGFPSLKSGNWGIDPSSGIGWRNACSGLVTVAEDFQNPFG